MMFFLAILFLMLIAYQSNPDAFLLLCNNVKLAVISDKWLVLCLVLFVFLIVIDILEAIFGFTIIGGKE